MRYFIRLSYNGSEFHGWQRQPNADSVQERLESALGTIFRRPIYITGAGRTDTGVHARTMFAHFDIDKDISDTDRLKNSLNRMCGRNISVHEIHEVPESLHARFDAKSRTYKYFILYEKSAFFYPLSVLSTPLDVEKMNEAAALLLDTSDFTSFAKLHSDAKTNICQVTEARWSRLTGCNGIVFTITADRFLRNMVRAVVGTLVEVGRGKMSIEEFKAVIHKKNRCSAGISMPPEGLFLWDIKY
ncbi:MAG: tRNA pseudouridine(38-40) synthase TruA [Prevotella sp.]|nr:tRNA pseudouridine(38-40) synthase TruA [Bacteroides sp.]MCM1366072.1 tRNA pseudouridine(38-40) synthase TruA [Prevotella sp.]MCM1436557.1 tRNA pseudouridine(38-40) synthase TruA [Prevotella sp.]